MGLKLKMMPLEGIKFEGKKVEKFIGFNRTTSYI